MLSFPLDIELLIILESWLYNKNIICYKYMYILMYLSMDKHFTQIQLKVIISSFIIYYRMCNKSNTTGVTYRAGTVYPSGEHEFTPGFSRVCVARSLAFYVMLCTSLFVLLYFWPLHYMSFFDLRLLITFLISFFNI
jgi:hypothetical protein